MTKWKFRRQSPKNFKIGDVFNCPYCNVELRRLSSGHNYCSTECRRNWNLAHPPESPKACKECLELKPLDAFVLRSDLGSYKHICKVCTDAKTKRVRANHSREAKTERHDYQYKLSLKRVYGLTQQEYKDMYQAQKGLCAICKQAESGTRKRLSVDHCHTSGAVRGLLCHKCNPGIGMFRDDPRLLVRAACYLDNGDCLEDMFLEMVGESHSYNRYEIERGK